MSIKQLLIMQSPVYNKAIKNRTTKSVVLDSQQVARLL
jgi:hypothetical protein